MRVAILGRLFGAAAVSTALLGRCRSDKSSGSGSGNCGAYCHDFCAQLDKCNLDTGSCVEDCSAGLGAADCSNSHAADQLTCAELGARVQCASYCATLCTTAPNCGSFDP